MLRSAGSHIGGPYAVLVAEQLAASGARVILGLASAGRVSPELKIPSLVVPVKALRDEAYHCLRAAESVNGDAGLALALQTGLGGLGLPVVTGPVWTINAPYRETAEQLKRHASNGVLGVEMQAATLFAFGAARGVRCGVVAHVTNGLDYSPDDQFEKGTHQLGFEILIAMSRAGGVAFGIADLPASAPPLEPAPRGFSKRAFVSGLHSGSQFFPRQRFPRTLVRWAHAVWAYCCSLLMNCSRQAD